MTSAEMIPAVILKKKAVVYVRQSSPHQVLPIWPHWHQKGTSPNNAWGNQSRLPKHFRSQIFCLLKENRLVLCRLRSIKHFARRHQN